MFCQILQGSGPQDPVRFTKLLAKLNDYQAKQNAEQCIQHAFGCSPSVLHNRWRTYVLGENGRLLLVAYEHDRPITPAAIGTMRSPSTPRSIMARRTAWARRSESASL